MDSIPTAPSDLADQINRAQYRPSVDEDESDSMSLSKSLKEQSAELKKMRSRSALNSSQRSTPIQPSPRIGISPHVVQSPSISQGSISQGSISQGSVSQSTPQIRASNTNNTPSLGALLFKDPVAQSATRPERNTPLSKRPTNTPTNSVQNNTNNHTIQRSEVDNINDNTNNDNNNCIEAVDTQKLKSMMDLIKIKKADMADINAKQQEILNTMDALKMQVHTWMNKVEANDLEWNHRKINKKVKLTYEQISINDVLKIVKKLKGEEAMDRVIGEMDRCHTIKNGDKYEVKFIDIDPEEKKKEPGKPGRPKKKITEVPSAPKPESKNTNKRLKSSVTKKSRASIVLD